MRFQKHRIPSFRKIRAAFRIYRATSSPEFVLRAYREGKLKRIDEFLDGGGLIYVEDGRIVLKYDGNQVRLDVNQAIPDCFHLLPLITRLGWMIHVSGDVISVAIRGGDMLTATSWEDVFGIYLVFHELLPAEKLGWTMKASDGLIEVAMPGLATTVRVESWIEVCWLYEVSEDYADLDVEGKVVIDVGVHKGDSPIIFCLRGAAYVVGFEPHARFREIAERNFVRQGIQDRVELIGAGLGSYVRDFEGESQTRSAQELWDWKRLKKHLDEKPEIGNLERVLKMDCEGCEYEILDNKNSVRSLRDLGVTRFILEYHDRSRLDSLVHNLEEGGFRILDIVEKLPSVGIIKGASISGIGHTQASG